MALRHWKLERDADGLAWATLDVADASTNTLGAAVMLELASPPRAYVCLHLVFVGNIPLVLHRIL